MVGIKFDEFGNLSPSDKINLSLEIFKQIFVDKFKESRTRVVIFEGFQLFLADLYSFINIPFDIWVDGSFVTNKLNPNDIDIVIIINASILEHRGEEIEAPFKYLEAKQKYKVDAYTIAKYDKENPKYSLYQIEKAYWANWFGYSRRNRQGKRFPKGFIEININDYGNK